MRVKSAIAATAALALLSVAAPAAAATPYRPATPVARTSAAGPSAAGASTAASDHEATRQAVRDLLRTGTPGALAYVRDADGPWFTSSGTAERGTLRAPAVGDRFRVGSITKIFTATAVVQLAAQGRLRLDDTVEKWLPGLVTGNGNDGRRITVRQLLNHTSGLFDYTEDADLARTHLHGEGFLRNRFDRFTPQQVIKIALAHPPYHSPGQGWHYSNTNYALAGLIIEKASGRSYADQIRRTIINPLRLTSTTVPGTATGLPAPNLHGYSKLGETAPSARIYDVTEMSPTIPGAGGQIISTAPDLARFIAHLMNGTLVPQSYLKQMRTTVPLIPHLSYGLGLFERKLPCGRTIWGHGGQTQGYLSYTAATADGSHAATVALNSDWADPSQLDGVLDKEFCPGG
ncbi:serine hydrolase domain-containing protein [Streptomyces cinerochromogenes]|uniref:serine hydrolase domain-containing protein n=1 Tax=Streptomyces cinerochromogenes TaxID=66422 RepID=UPI0019B20571|nr:serine hydrolase domain-containing protein [Streptomyces cinerochromogenes]GGS93683.1 D-alanyl-D-alanine carboxypeptidase [Streptomyces cinerochromogenes]